MVENKGCLDCGVNDHMMLSGLSTIPNNDKKEDGRGQSECGSGEERVGTTNVQDCNYKRFAQGLTIKYMLHMDVIGLCQGN